MRTVELEVVRPNGETEIVDVSEKFGTISSELVAKIRKATKEAGRGDVVKMTVTTKKNNVKKLMKEYNNLHNEGASGYTPDGGYFTTSPDYKTWEETKEYK